ncbi:MAG: putative acid phosphatase [Myxococcales bacterium]|nr:putative acid phosphatase [Myxococcales bacterium]
MKPSLWLVMALAACGSSKQGAGVDSNTSGGDGGSPSDGSSGGDGQTATTRTIFIIPMENEPTSLIYGNTTDARYINDLLSTSASASMFKDELPALLSEPHYIWMEAGTNAFSDHTFSGDGAPTATNSTASTAHLATQLETAHIPWMAYQQGITSNTCPIAASGVYAPKHDPFVFFRDVVGATPSASAPLCSAHHKAYTAFAQDLQAGITGYVFITPDLCHDMHGDAACPQGTAGAANIQAGDAWLKAELPRIITYTQTHDALIFITWDEGDSSNLIPFIAIGTHVKAGDSATMYTHSSMLKSVEEYLHVPVLPSVASANDFSGMFMPGTFP